MNVVEIDVKKWGRNEEYNKCTGRYCAIGFAQLAADNGKVSHELPKLLTHNIYDENNNYVATINDEWRGAKRREKLRELFALAGVKLRFKNLKKYKLPKCKSKA